MAETEQGAGRVTVLSTRATRGVLEAILPGAAAAGLDVAVEYGATNELLPRIAAGERADLVLLTGAALDRLCADGIVDPDSRTDIARALVGMAVGAGEPRPDISTVDALVATLRAARAVAWSRTGASGLHFARVLTRLGILEEIAAKAIVRDGFTGELAAKGEVELAVQQVSELMAVTGVDIIGPLPEAVQEVTAFAGGVFVGAKNPAGARALLARLVAPEARPLIARSGLQPL
ncbi:MAG: substrate-binding domain-containing protein [Rhodoplanes sp.]|uniref:molybdate ABC transporter substrate-binding protein n=1 Tax=Rhodoplanes sp. TaxID=1968906 RepID=UPI0018193D6B|nr:substrate-binding domain-containing protein [Rhodoplanes sp.]NVO17736.1 substrate-binding domain-containing protein [Rhodoplanes sp.]